jgi:hypothetical protein
MSKSELTLRSWPVIALAYVLGPFVGLNALCAATTLPAIYDPNFSPEGAATGWFLVLFFGGIACLIVELVVVTPLLRGFNRHRWPWLNGWSGAAIGFLLGAVPWLILTAPNPTLSPDQMPGGITVCTKGHCTAEGWAQAGLGPVSHAGHVVWEIDGHWTLAGWAHVAHEAAMMGVVGLIAAIVFRAIAVRSSGLSTHGGLSIANQVSATPH